MLQIEVALRISIQVYEFMISQRWKLKVEFIKGTLSILLVNLLSFAVRCNERTPQVVPYAGHEFHEFAQDLFVRIRKVKLNQLTRI